MFCQNFLTFFALFLDDDDEYLDVSDEQDKNKENSDIIEGIIFTFSFSLFLPWT